MASVCRVCLASNMRLRPLKNNLLINVYEQLSNNKFNSEDARPRAVCCFCYQMLLRCLSFSQMACRSENIFSQRLHKGQEATPGNIAELNIGIKKYLSVATMQFINVNTINESPHVNLKDVPICKQEKVTTEDQLAKFESNSHISEDCIKTEVIFEEDSYQVNDVEELTSNTDVERTKPDDSIRTFICKDGTKVFFNKNKLISHIRKSHSKETENQYSCNVGEKHFNQKSLNTHKKTHSGEKPFACNVCDKQFSVKKYLIAHLRTHTGEKPFACNVCDKQFRLRMSLICHIRTHTGEKPFACYVCDMQFSVKNNLSRHMRTHTGEKPFACNVCDRQFALKQILTHHMRTHTRE